MQVWYYLSPGSYARVLEESTPCSQGDELHLGLYV